MDRYETLSRKLKERKPVFMANLMVCDSPLLLPAFSSADCVLLDKEHGVFGTEELVPMTMQCRAMGLPAIVRVEDSLYHLVAKAIDLGADGIMVPRTETVEQVKTVVEAMHFFPEGRTGFGGWGILREGENVESFNKNRLLLLQIESRKGLENMEAMIESYGKYIDGFIIGPNDYSILEGVPLRHDVPVMLEQYERFYGICKKHGISCGVFDPDREHVRRDAAFGANIFWLGDDVTYVRRGFESMIDMALEELGGK